VTLVSELIDAASGDSVATPVLLRRVKVLAARLKTGPLAEWVDHELSGYDSQAPLPSYRGPFRGESRGTFSGPFGSSMSNAPIPIVAFDEKYRSHFDDYFKIEIRQGVAELEDMSIAAASDSGNLHFPWPADAIAYANMLWQQGAVHWYEGMGLTGAHIPVPASLLRGVLDTVRTRVLDLALAIESEDPQAGSAANGESIAPDTVTNIFNTTVMGGNLAIGSQGVSQVLQAPPRTEEELLARLASLGVDEALVRELRDALDEDRAAGESNGTEPGSRVRNWLGKVAVRSARAGGEVATGASGDLIAQLVMGLFT
jgi:hypothetical protein